MATPKQVKQALMVVMPLFANYKPPVADAEIKAFEAAWHRQVGHLDVELLNLALADAAGKSEFFPTPKAVLDSAARITQPVARTGEEAWGDVLRAVAEFGYLHPPVGLIDEGEARKPWTFSDKRALAVVKQMGWRRLCLDEDATLQWQFIHAYKALGEREATEARELPAVTDARRLVEAQRLMSQIGAPKNGEAQKQP